VAVTTAASHLASSSIEASSAADAASSRKETKYVDLSVNHEFVPAFFEIRGPVADNTHRFLSDLGRRTTLVTHDIRDQLLVYMFSLYLFSVFQYSYVTVLNANLSNRTISNTVASSK
jgi:hypothetical protein